ncbi:phasin [Aquibium sp. A9E412]|uniref:phasin n=1 Tax=Aquibium sp. A9E412 TaxID=2976767 RepID=UPI0025B1E571|nr:phasin [Aquibium sp. A9E412]MDN2567589.1 phasin [Aquibium sp. A9E412]
MSKTNTKTAETVEFPTFDASKTTDQMRAFAEKGMEQSKEAYAKMKVNAEETQKALESTFETAKSASDAFALKSLAAMRANADAGFSHMEAMIKAGSVSEMMELQAGFVRKQMERAMEQSKDFQALSSKTASDMTAPMKDAFDKAMKDLKVA